MRRNRWALVLTGALTIFGASCAKKTVSDQALTAAVQSKLYADATTRAGNVAVAVKDGVVTLSGDAPSTDVELAAVKIANGTDGVRTVQDQIKVASAAAVPPPVPSPEPAPAPAPAPASNLAPKNSPAPATNPTPAAPATSELAQTPSPDAKPAGQPPVRKPVVPQSVTLPAGTRVTVRTTDVIDSGKATEGQTYRGSLDSPMVSDGRVIVPAGSDVTLTIGNVKAAGRIKGNSSLDLKATSLQYRGRSYDLATSIYAGTGNARGKNTAIKTGIGAAAGALIGGLAGGGKGAGIGAAAGGGAGFGWNALTHGQQVKIPAETVLNFKLESPLTVPAGGRASSDAQ